jgi:hypothetical protein
MAADTQKPPVDEKPIWGCAAIADEIDRTKRQTFHLLENGIIEARKVGGRWCAYPSRLRRSLTGDAA